MHTPGSGPSFVAHSLSAVQATHVEAEVLQIGFVGSWQ